MAGYAAIDESTLAAKRRLLRMHFESGVGHIGGNLSCLDLLLAVFQRCLFSHDRFVLSKGHSAGALYIALWASGRLDESHLGTFHRDGTLLAGHPCAGWHEDILFATGSLGHGLSLAAGLAHGMTLRNDLGTVFCLVSDGELNEGSTWEALHYAAHHRLANLKILIDANGIQGFGRTEDVMRIGSTMERLKALGFATRSIDGHNADDIDRALLAPSDAPSAIYAKTVKGKGVSFMENKVEWHYLPLTEALYVKAMNELDVTERVDLVSKAVKEPPRPEVG